MLELLVLGAIAVLLISRLFQVLGQKTGYENPNLAQMMSEKLSQEVFSQEEAASKETPDKVLNDDLEPLVQKIKTFDPAFRTDWFLEGAGRAFELLIEAFSKGERPVLQGLLSSDIYQSFETSLLSREEKKQRLVTTLVKLEPLEIVDIKLTESKARITVQFVSEQINILYDETGAILEGSPKQIEEITDEWTFERDLVSQNPNWQVVEIKS